MSSPGMLILVADDWVDAAEAMAVILNLEGFRTLVAFDGEQALAMLREHTPDVAILDLAMPKLDGLELAKRVCSEPGHRPLLIARSGRCTREDIERALSAGFDHFFMKPVDPQELLTLLKSHDKSLPSNGIAGYGSTRSLPY
jgi:DNA-binding response OmpR family regulator